MGTHEAQALWEQYEAALGEKALARALGRYIGGWEEFAPPLWGLLVLTEKTFRFHHFAQENWLTSWILGSGGAKEKIIAIPREKLTGIDFAAPQAPWWKRLFIDSRPVLSARYRKDDGGEGTLRIETGPDARALISLL